jgi:iron complex transport system ATP-binding protein
MTEHVARFRDVSFVRGDAVILSHINWTVRRGEHWILFGPNGAGKSTMHNLATGYLWPTDGEIFLLGEKLGTVDVRDLRRSIGLVSESIRMMISPELTGREVLITGARAHLNLFGEATEEEDFKAEQIARQADCERLLEKSFGVLSTGEKQRLVIARALMTDPALVILDEPCAGLDIAGREFVLSAISSIARSASSPALVFTTHHVEEILPEFSRALVLKSGRVFASGKISDVISSEKITALFGIPVEIFRGNNRMSSLVKARE